MKKYLKNLVTALKNDTDGARAKTLKAVSTTVLAVAAGIVLSKLNEDKHDIIVINESPVIIPEDTIIVEETDNEDTV